MQKELGEVPRASSRSVASSMRGNRGKNTMPELSLRKALFAAGIRGYRLHNSGAPGHPDIAFNRSRVAIFVDGCYWHRCPKCNLPLPKEHREFWRKKFELNKGRDIRKRRALESDGWRVVTIWECEIRGDVKGCVEKVKTALQEL